MSQIITVTFPAGAREAIAAEPLEQWAYGQQLRFVGLGLPASYQVDFSNFEFCGASIPRVGNASGVSVPVEVLTSGRNVYAFIWIQDETSGARYYRATVRVVPGPAPDPEESPEEQSAVTEAINALNMAAWAIPNEVELAVQRAIAAGDFSGVFWATYGETTSAEITEALEDRKIVLLEYATLYFTLIAGVPGTTDTSYVFTCFTGDYFAKLSVTGSTWSVGEQDMVAHLASPAFSGTPTAPTAPAGTDTDQLATTAFVQRAIAGGGGEGESGPARVAADETIIQAIDRTVNLYDPSTATAGYILLENEPSPQSGYEYSDYIKIGCVPFAHSAGGTISDQVSCYDAEKNYIGAISFAKNAERMQQFDPFGNANLRYTMFWPFANTVYIRVNHPSRRPKMITPFFAPLAYGATAQNLAYGESFTKYGLKVAMFGDSITLGRDGNSAAIIAENIPFYLRNLAGWNVDNFGVGSMGWVSTQYLDAIAYDKISDTDLTPYDLITLAYGVNDTQADLGAWDTSDETTVCGQIHKCIRYIANSNNKARIVLIAPWNTASGSFPDWRYPVVTARGWSREEMSQRMEQIATYYHIGFVSQLDSPLFGYGVGLPDGTKTHQFIGTDDVHLTAAGYKAVGHWLAAKLQAFSGPQVTTGAEIPSAQGVSF